MFTRLRNLTARLDEQFNERRLGIATAEWHPQVVEGNPDFRGYSPTTYRDWRIIRRHIVSYAKPGPSSSLIDYGAGLGRSTILAAQLPFRRVIGVEFDADLVRRGNANIQAAGTTTAEIVLADAAAFHVPPDATAFYFCNPFTGAVLAGALDLIKQSHLLRIRQLAIFCNLPPKSAFEAEISKTTWLRLVAQSPLWSERRLLIFSPRS